MGLFDDLYKPYNQIASPAGNFGATAVNPTNNNPLLGAYDQIASPQPKPEENPIIMLLRELFKPQNQQPREGLAAQLAALRNDVQGDANKTTQLPSTAPGSASPFLTGFFKNPYLR